MMPFLMLTFSVKCFQPANEGVTGPVDFDPSPGWQGFLAAPSRRRERSAAGSGLRGVRLPVSLHHDSNIVINAFLGIIKRSNFKVVVYFLGKFIFRHSFM